MLKSTFYTLSKPRELHLNEEFIDTEKLNDDEIVAKTLYSAISPGTEVAAYSGIEPLRDDVQAYPRLVGYCNVAEITHKGRAVVDWEVGDVVLSFQSHRTYFVCRASDFLIRVDKDFVKESALTYLYHLGYHAMQTAQLQLGQNVGIIGLGVLGYTSAVFGKLGGGNVIVFSNQEKFERPFFQENLIYLNKNHDDPDFLLDITDGNGLDIIINTSNTWDDWILAMKCVRKGGVIVNVGFPGRGAEPPRFNPLDPKYLYMKGVTIKYLSIMDLNNVSSDLIRFNKIRNMNHILGLIKKRIINPNDIISAVINPRDLEAQYKLYESRTQRLFSTLLEWC